MSGAPSPSPCKRIYPGDKVGLEWCSNCRGQTEHIYGFVDGRFLSCLKCHPEAEKALAQTYGKRENSTGD